MVCDIAYTFYVRPWGFMQHARKQNKIIYFKDPTKVSSEQMHKNNNSIESEHWFQGYINRTLFPNVTPFLAFI